MFFILDYTAFVPEKITHSHLISFWFSIFPPEIEKQYELTFEGWRIAKKINIHLFFSLFHFLWREITAIYVCNMGLGEGNGTPLQYSCLENSMDGGPW